VRAHYVVHVRPANAMELIIIATCHTGNVFRESRAEYMCVATTCAHVGFVVGPVACLCLSVCLSVRLLLVDLMLYDDAVTFIPLAQPQQLR